MERSSLREGKATQPHFLLRAALESVLMLCRPGTAMLFALTIVEALMGKEKRNEITGPLMVAQTL
jgi:hypothetical protein